MAEYPSHVFIWFSFFFCVSALPVSEDVARSIICKLLSVISYLHAMGIVHR